jgi:hypothetical protein
LARWARSPSGLSWALVRLPVRLQCPVSRPWLRISRLEVRATARALTPKTRVARGFRVEQFVREGKGICQTLVRLDFNSPVLGPAPARDGENSGRGIYSLETLIVLQIEAIGLSWPSGRSARAIISSSRASPIRVRSVQRPRRLRRDVFAFMGGEGSGRSRSAADRIDAVTTWLLSTQYLARRRVSASSPISRRLIRDMV